MQPPSVADKQRPFLRTSETLGHLPSFERRTRDPNLSSLRASASAGHLQITTVARMAPADQFRPGTQKHSVPSSARADAPRPTADTAEYSSQFDPRVGVRLRAAQSASLANTEENRQDSRQEGVPPLRVQTSEPLGLSAPCKPQGFSSQNSSKSLGVALPKGA